MNPKSSALPLCTFCIFLYRSSPVCLSRCKHHYKNGAWGRHEKQHRSNDECKREEWRMCVWGGVSKTPLKTQQPDWRWHNTAKAERVSTYFMNGSWSSLKPALSYLGLLWQHQPSFKKAFKSWKRSGFIRRWVKASHFFKRSGRNRNAMALKSTAPSSWCCELSSDILLLPWLMCWALIPWTFLHSGIETTHEQFLSQTGTNNLPTYEVQFLSEGPCMSPITHLHEWCLCPLVWGVPFPWVQVTQPAPAAYGLSWPWFHPRLIYELPFWKNIQGSTWHQEWQQHKAEMLIDGMLLMFPT